MIAKPRMFAAAALFASLTGCATFVGHDLVSGDGTPGEIAVANQLSAPITVVTISKCNAMSHGLNRLGDPIPIGEGRRWKVDAGCWDVQAGYGWQTGYSVTKFHGLQVQPGRRWILTAFDNEEEMKAAQAN